MQIAWGHCQQHGAHAKEKKQCCVRKAACGKAAQGCGGGMRCGWGRCSTGCGHEGREERTWHHLSTRLMPPQKQTDQVTSSDFFIARGQWLAPRSQPLQRSTAPVKKRERAILSPFRISRKPRLLRLGHPQKGDHHSETESLHPSAHPAHLQPRLLRSFGQRSGARRREKNAEAEPRSSRSKHVCFTSLSAKLS